MMVYETENLQEKYIEELNKVRDQYSRHCHQEIEQVSGDKPPTSERMTITDDPDMPSIEFTNLEEEKGSIAESDRRDSNVIHLKNYSGIDMIENEAFIQNQRREEEANSMDKNIKISSKYIGKYPNSQNEAEANHILVSEQEEPRKILIKKIYQESDFDRESSTEKQYEEEKETYQTKLVQDIYDHNEPVSIQRRYDIQKNHLQVQLQNYKDAYLLQSQYLSGITEKSEEESGYTNQIYKSSSYVNNEGRKQDAFASSNSSATSSNINSRLLKYFEDSLQKDIPIAMSPSQALQVFNESNQVKEGSRSHSNLFPVEEEDRRISTDDIISKEGKDGDISNYSLTKSNNYEDLTSNNTSSKKNNYKNFFIPNKQESESDNDQKRIQFDQVDSNPGSPNSSMERKERNAKNFIEITDNTILNELSENEKNLNISSISRLEESAISNKVPASEEEKSMLEENKEKIISRQPTFSRFTPNLRDDKETHEDTS